MDSSSATDMAAHIGHGKLQRSGSDPSLVFLANHTNLFFRYSTYPKAKFLDKEKGGQAEGRYFDHRISKKSAPCSPM
jgi:hypothetical protein